MKNAILSLMSVGVLGLVSCDKEKVDQASKDFIDELSQERMQVTVMESGFQMEETSSTTKSQEEDYYVSGVLTYQKNEEVLAIVDFGDGTEDSEATLTVGTETSFFDLKKEEDEFNGEKSKYKKVVVEPIVKADDCDYIVAGIIKYYDVENGDWVATIDFGDGSCDDIATKTTADSEEIHEFSLSEWK